MMSNTRLMKTVVCSLKGTKTLEELKTYVEENGLVDKYLLAIVPFGSLLIPDDIPDRFLLKINTTVNNYIVVYSRKYYLIEYVDMYYNGRSNMVPTKEDTARYSGLSEWFKNSNSLVSLYKDIHELRKKRDNYYRSTEALRKQLESYPKDMLDGECEYDEKNKDKEVKAREFHIAQITLVGQMLADNIAISNFLDHMIKNFPPELV